MIITTYFLFTLTRDACPLKLMLSRLNYRTKELWFGVKKADEKFFWLLGRRVLDEKS